MLKFQNPNNFRHLILLSVLTGKNITIEKTEVFENYEKIFLELISEITIGTKIFLSNKNKKLDFKPGTIEQRHFEKEINFNCGLTRSITYYIEPIIIIGLFCKDFLEIKFSGITNDSIDFPIDNVKNALLPFLEEIYDGLLKFELKIEKRGFRPSGNGSVYFKINSIKKKLPSLRLNKTEKLIKRIRGVAVTSKTTSQFLTKMISKIRELFNDYIPDVWVYSELVKNNPDHFYGVSLYTNNFMISDFCFDALNLEQKNNFNPEKVAETAVFRLLDEIKFSSSIVCTNFQSFILIMMALGEKKISSVELGRLSQHSIWIIRWVKVFLDVEFNFEDCEGKNEGNVLVKCVGSGLCNRNTELE